MKTNMMAALALVAAGLASPAMAQTTTACYAALGLVPQQGDTLVLAPEGGGSSAALHKFEKGEGPTARNGLSVVSYDPATCQPVAAKVWIQDQFGEVVAEGDQAVTSFPAAPFAKGVTYLRADRDLNRNIVYLLRSGV